MSEPPFASKVRFDDVKMEGFSLSLQISEGDTY